MSFEYNNEVIDLLFKKTLGTTYTSSNLVPGQEDPVLQKIHNEQIFGEPIPNDTIRSQDWGDEENVIGGQNKGKKYSLKTTISTESNEGLYNYIKKYTDIPLIPIPGTNNRAWQTEIQSLRETFKNVILGKGNFSFDLSTSISGYETIYSSNSLYKPIINNGVLIFLGNTTPPTENDDLKFKNVFVYEGGVGATVNISLNSLGDVSVSNTPGNGEPLVYNDTTNKWENGIIGRDFIELNKLEDLIDVSFNPIPQNRMTLRYDTDDLWKPATLPDSLNDLDDVDLNGGDTVVNGSSIVYQNGKYVPKLVSEPITSLNDLPDIDICNNELIDDTGLIYDTTKQKWVNKPIQPLIERLDDISGITLPDDMTGKDDYTLVYKTGTGKWELRELGIAINELDDILDVNLTSLKNELPEWSIAKKIEASDLDISDNYGASVDMIDNFAVVGSIMEDVIISNIIRFNAGSAYVYRNGSAITTWTEIQKLIPEPATIGDDMSFGKIVKITEQFIVVSAPYYSFSYNNNGNTVPINEGGAVYIYNYNNATGIYGVESDLNVVPNRYKENFRLILSNPESYDWFGWSMDIYGNYLLIGSNQRNASPASTGKAYIYKYNGSVWNYIKSLSISDSVNNDEYGHAVTINDTFAFVSSAIHDNNKGAVYIYKKDEGGTDNFGYITKIMLKNPYPNDYFGYSMSANNTNLIVGAIKNTEEIGQAYLIEYNSTNDTWGAVVDGNLTNETSIVRSVDRIEEEGDSFGASVSIKENWGIIGCYLADTENNVISDISNNTGIAYIIQNSGEGYWEVRKQILPDDIGTDDQFGYSVGINENFGIIGAWRKGLNKSFGGAAYIINLPELQGGSRCLVYDTDTGRWKGAPITSAGGELLIQELDDLTNVEVSGNTISDIAATDGQALVYDSINNRWIPGDVQEVINSINDISGVDTTGKVDGHTLVYENGVWKSKVFENVIESINDILDVHADNPSNGDALIYKDVSNAWVLGEVKGLVNETTGIKSMVRPETSNTGDVYYDNSHNAFYGKLPEGWREMLLQNTPLLFGQPSLIKNQHNKPFIEMFVDRIEISWLNPDQFPCGIKPTNSKDLVNNALYLPVINDIQFKYIKVADGDTNGNDFSAPLNGIINIGGKAISERVIDNRNMQTISQATDNKKLTNKVIIYKENTTIPTNLSNNWTNFDTALNGSFKEYDYIEKDSDGNQVYHFNPGSEHLHFKPNNKYSISISLSNSLSNTIATINNKEFLNIETFEAEPPSKLKVADLGNTNGFHALIQRTNDVHSIKIVINKEALSGVNGDGDNVYVTKSTADYNSSIFFESYEIEYRTCVATTNVNTATASITESNWSAWGNTISVSADTPLMNVTDISNSVYTSINLPEYDNKFYQFKVRAKNNYTDTYGEWSDNYTIRFNKPEKINLDSIDCSFKGIGNKWYAAIPVNNHKSSKGSNNDTYTHDVLKIQEYRISANITDENDSNTNYANYKYYDGSNDTLTEILYELGNDVSNNKSFKFKVESRNWLFGDDNDDADGNASRWSEISNETNSLTATTPSYPYHKKMKFYEKNTKDTDDPWDALDEDYLAYQWNAPTSIGGTGLTIDEYIMEFEIGLGQITSNTIAFEDYLGTNWNVTEISTEEEFKYFKVEGSDTIFTCSNVSNATITFVNNESLSGLKSIYAYRKIKATDKALGANTYYLRKYNSNLMKNLTENSFTYRNLTAENYFKKGKTLTTGFTGPSKLIIEKPSNPRLGTPHRPVVELDDDGVILTISEPSPSTLTHNNNPNNMDLFSIGIKEYNILPTIEDVESTVLTLLDNNGTSNGTGEKGILTHSMTNDNKIQDMTGNRKIDYAIKCKNNLYNVFTDPINISFVLGKPTPVDFTNSMLFQWDNVTNNIHLIVKPEEGGLKSSDSSYNTTGNYTQGTITPVSSVVGLTENLHIYNNSSKLKWEVRLTSNSTALTNYNTSWKEITDDADKFKSGDQIIDLGSNNEITKDKSYNFNLRTRNKYVNEWLENSYVSKFLISEPSSAPTFNTSKIVIAEAKLDGTSDENYMDISFNKPDACGLYAKHASYDGTFDENNVLIIDKEVVENHPNIKQYDIIIKEKLNGGGYEYEKTISELGVQQSDGVYVRRDASTNVIIDNTRFSYNIKPETDYEIFNIKSYNWFFPAISSGVDSDISANDRPIINGAVPRTIEGAYRDISDNYKPDFPADLSGNYSSTTRISNVNNFKLLDISTPGTPTDNTPQPTKVPKKLIGTAGTDSIIVSSSVKEHVLINKLYKSPGSNNTMQIYIDINGTSSNKININKNVVSGEYNLYYNGSVNVCKMVLTNNIKDIYHASSMTQNQGYWYKFEDLKFELIPEGIKQLYGGEKITITINYTYNASDGSSESISNTIVTDEIFDSVETISSIKGTPNITYQPYYIYDMPTLYNNNWGNNKFIKISYEIDNKSKHFVMNDYVTKLDLSGVNSNNENIYLFNNFDKTWDENALSGTSDKFILKSKDNTYPHYVTDGQASTNSQFDGSFNNAVVARLHHQNIEGGDIHILKKTGDKNYKFIFDPDTYTMLKRYIEASLALSDVISSAVSVTTASNDEGFDENNLKPLTLLSGPNTFDPLTTTSYLHGTTKDWEHGLINIQNKVYHNTDSYNRLMIFKGGFQSPAAFQNEFSNVDFDEYHDNVKNIYDNYSETISNDFVISSNNNVFKDNYKWQFYKYKYKNSHSSISDKNVFYSQIYLGDDTNTNIELSDLLNETDTAANVCIMIKSYDVDDENGTNKWESPFFLGIRGKQGHRDGQMSDINNFEYYTNPERLVWTLPGGVIAPSMGQIFDGTSNPSNNNWKQYKRVLPFAHKKVRIKPNTSISHIIAIGLRKDKDLNIGNVYAGRKYQAGPTINDCYKVPP